jgi:hypothetical protein
MTEFTKILFSPGNFHSSVISYFIVSILTKIRPSIHTDLKSIEDVEKVPRSFSTLT